jgi:hypothetical protein
MAFPAEPQLAYEYLQLAFSNPQLAPYLQSISFHVLPTHLPIIISMTGTVSELGSLCVLRQIDIVGKK